MKTTIIYIIVGLFILTIPALSQDVPKLLEEANTSYNSGDLENARFALQEALNGINQAIGKEILDLLPDKIGLMDKVDGSDNVTGANIGFAGLFVNREYRDEKGDFNFQIMSDSPMLSAISSLLSMSVFMAADPNQKRIKLDGYKTLLTRSEDEEGNVSYEAQLPFGNSLMTFDIHGIKDQDSIEELLGELPVAEIIKMAE